MLEKEIKKWAAIIDNQYADLHTQYGAFKKDDKWIVNLWQPLAREVTLIIYEKNNPTKQVKKIIGNFISPNWNWILKEDWSGYFYQFEIIQNDGSKTLALDPFAKSMAPFDWQGKTNNVGKGAFVEVRKRKKLFRLNKINDPQLIIYEASIRDLTSWKKDLTNPGTYQAIIEAKIAEHLQDLGFNAIQFLPVHSCYTLNENERKILHKNEGQGWNTNYNWGYDPHNYFSLNGWYSTKVEDPYKRIAEFKKLVDYFHAHHIKVIVDVVYNHLMTNKILDNILPNYYFRTGELKELNVVPVAEPALASERAMTRRIIIESLEHFVKVFDVDGFRFDLLTFTDLETVKQLAKRLRALKPHLILHGEAWNFSDLKPGLALNKKYLDNNLDIAYFNDSTRNAIRGEDDGEGFAPGIIGGNVDQHFGTYLAGIIANVKNYPFEPRAMSKISYDRFTQNANNNLQYISCHDGHTLWDKINLITTGDLEVKLNAYRQAIMLLMTTQGKILFLAGSEFLASKPLDLSGADNHRYHQSDNALDLFNQGKKYQENSYKTTDYTNGLRWEQLSGRIKDDIYDFLREINHFRTETPFFNLSFETEIGQSIKFKNVDQKKGIIDFKIKVKNQQIRIIHNLKKEPYFYETRGKVYLSSAIKQMLAGQVPGQTSQIIKY